MKKSYIHFMKTSGDDDNTVLLSLEDIKNIWLEIGTFVPYPDVLEFYVEQKSTQENWPDDVKVSAMDIASKIKRFDKSTGLQKPDYFVFNRQLIEEYISFQEKNNDVLEKLEAVRYWGDIVNMGGINIALSLDTDFAIDEDKSVQGIERANKFIRLVTEVIQLRLKEVEGVNNISLYREGGDEIGGYLLTNERCDMEALEKAVEQINEDVESIARQLQLSNIVHRKNPDRPECMGGGFVSACARADFVHLGRSQVRLEKEVEKKKKEMSQQRLQDSGNQMIRKIPQEMIQNISNIFYQIVADKQLKIDDAYDVPLQMDSEALKGHVIPGKARHLFIEELLNRHPDHQHLNAFFDQLLQSYNQNSQTGVYNLTDADTAIMLASKNYQGNGYFIIAQQTNFTGINQKFGHEFCDRFFEQLSGRMKEVLDELHQTGQLKGEFGMFNIEVHNIVTKNSVAIILQAPDQESVIQIIEMLNEDAAKLIKKQELDKLDNLNDPSRKGVFVSFGVQAIPQSVFHPGIAKKIKADTKEQAEKNEKANVVFNPKLAFGKETTCKQIEKKSNKYERRARHGYRR